MKPWRWEARKRCILLLAQQWGIGTVDLIRGLTKGWGDLTFQDSSWSPELIAQILAEFESEWQLLEGTVLTNTVWKRKEGELIFLALMGEISYVLGLRGEELPLMDLAGTRTNSARGKVHPKTKHGVVALLGRFKNEIGEKYRLMPVPMQTVSGLRPMRWIDPMVEWYGEKGIVSGPVLRDRRGECARYGDNEYGFLTRMAKVQERNPDLFAKPDSNVLMTSAWGAQEGGVLQEDL
jgi:hypothetical protein